jgi:hypothetical protein
MFVTASGRGVPVQQQCVNRCLIKNCFKTHCCKKSTTNRLVVNITVAKDALFQEALTQKPKTRYLLSRLSTLQCLWSEHVVEQRTKQLSQADF